MRKAPAATIGERGTGTFSGANTENNWPELGSSPPFHNLAPNPRATAGPCSSCMAECAPLRSTPTFKASDLKGGGIPAQVVVQGGKTRGYHHNDIGFPDKIAAGSRAAHANRSCAAFSAEGRHLMSEASDSAVEAKEKSQAVALVIAVLALLLALAEAGAKNAQHLSTEKNIESSDLFNFYQAKRIRSTVVETAAQMLEAQKTAVSDPNAQAAFEKQIGDFKATVARFEKDPKTPEDSLDAIQERAKDASESRELANR